MKISTESNFQEEQSGSSQESLTDTISISGDSDLDAVSAAGDQNQMIQELKNTIQRNLSQISDLENKLKITEIHLECQKDKVKDKDDVIRVLLNSIDLITKTNALAIKQMQKPEAEVVTCNNDNNLQKQKESINLTDEMEPRVRENDMDNIGAQLQELECQAKNTAESNGKDNYLEKLQAEFDKCKEQNKSLELSNSELMVELEELKSKIIESQKIEGGLRKQVSELENNFLSVSAKLKESSEKLAEYTFNIANSPDKEETVPLNNTKDPKIKVIQRDGIQPFMAVIEDIPSAGTGWMVIQRRIDGKAKFSGCPAYGDGFGDLKTNFWLGTEIIHQLTTRQRHELYIQVVDLDDVSAYARYDHFEIGSEDEDYKIKSLGSYSGNAGDAFRSLQNAPLEKWTYSDKPFYYWWYNAQMDCNLNGQHMLERRSGFYWGRWCPGKKECHLKSCQMFIRPRPS